MSLPRGLPLAQWSFQELLVPCGIAPETAVRQILEAAYAEYEFRSLHDDYESTRGNAEGITNLLAVRGKRARTSCVACTNVCRDHDANGLDVHPPAPIPVWDGEAGRGLLR